MNAQIINDRQSISPILFKPSVLGREFDIVVAKFKGKIALPRLNNKASSTFKPVLPPKNYDIGVLHLIHKEDKLRWGRQIAQPSGVTVVENYLVEFELAKTKAKASEQMALIEKVLDNWFLLLRDWLEVLTHQDLSLSEPLGGVQDSGNFLWSWKGRTIWRTMTASSIILTLSSPAQDQAVTLRQWKAAVKNTNAGKIPPEEHLLLRDARARLLRGQYNYSVIFSAIATEITLKNQLEQKLTKSRKRRRLIKSVLRNTLGKLLDTCETLGITFPSNTHSDLLEPRNKAMHRHTRLTREEAAKCLAVSDKIVNTYIKL